MTLSKNAIGNLINRYKAVLKKCRILNTFGTLAIMGSLAMSSVSLAATSGLTEFTPTLDNHALLATLTDSAGSPLFTAEQIATMASMYIVESAVPEKEYYLTFTKKENNTDVVYGVLVKDPKNPTITHHELSAVIKSAVSHTGNGYQILEGTGTPQFESNGTTYTVVDAAGQALTATGARLINPTTDVTSNFYILPSSNSQGGAIFNESSTAGAVTGNFISNTAASSGGAIYNAYYATMGNINGDFIANATSNYDGGAIYSDESSQIGNIVGNFIGNEARFDGGAIANDNSSIIGNISGNFVGNSAGDEGGAIYNDYHSVMGNITGNFIDNYAEDNGGAINNEDHAIIGNITGNFIGNEANDDDGGAIFNEDSGQIGNVVGDFIDNEADSDGGAIYNHNRAVMGDIVGDFINNTADDDDGGAISNDDSSKIGNIVGDFIGNTAGAEGGAIYNDDGAFINSIVGDFIGNSAGAGGGAIYNEGGAFIGNINGNFIDNTTTSSGGAIYTDTSLSFVATGENENIFSGNISQLGDVAQKYNAIYVASNAAILNFTMQDKADFRLDDTIDGGSYNIKITGQNAAENVFTLNNALNNTNTLTITNATLSMGDVTHKDGNTYSASLGDAHLQLLGTVFLQGNFTPTQSITVDHGETTLLGTMLLENGASLNVAAGTFDITNNGLTVNSTAGNFEVGNIGTLKANMDQLGTLTGTTFTALPTTSINKKLTGTGSLSLMVDDSFSMTKEDSVDFTSNIDWSSIVDDNVSVALEGANITGLYSLNKFINGAHNEAVMAGTMSSGAASFTHIVPHTNGTKNSVIAAQAFLALTGAQGGPLFSGNTVTNSGTLILGGANVPTSLTGQLTALDASTTFASSSNVTGTVNIQGGELALTGSGTYVDISAATFEASNTSTLNLAQDTILHTNLSDFANINLDGSLDTTNASIQSSIINNGTLSLVGTGELNKLAKVRLYQDLNNLFSGEGTFSVSGLTYSGLYSLDAFIDDAPEEAVMAGTMVADGYATFTGIIKNTHTQSTTSLIEKDAQLHLTGNNAGNILLDEGTLTVEGILFLGGNAVDSAVVNGDITLDVSGELEANSHITIDGKFTTNDGSATFYDGVTFNTDVTVNSGYLATYDGTTFNADVTINNGYLASYDGATFNADVAINNGNFTTYDGSTFNESVTISGNSKVRLQNGTINIAKDITLQNDASLTVSSSNMTVLGTLTVTDAAIVTLGYNSYVDTTNGTLKVDTTHGFNILENATLRADLANFGVIESGTLNTTTGLVKTKLNLDGTLELFADDGTNMSKIESLQMSRSMDWSSILNSTSTGEVLLSGANITGLYSLTFVPYNIELSENIMAGTLGEDGESYTVAAHGIVKNSLDQSITSVIKNGSSLHLTGANADKILLDEGSLSNEGTLTLGSHDVPLATVKGEITNTFLSNLNTQSHIVFDGKVSNNGFMNLYAGSTFNKAFTMNDGEVHLYDGSTFNEAFTMYDGEVYLYDGSTFKGDVTIKGGSAYLYDGSTFKGDVALNEGSIRLEGNNIFNSAVTIDGPQNETAFNIRGDGTFNESLTVNEGTFYLSGKGTFAKEVHLNDGTTTFGNSSNPADNIFAGTVNIAGGNVIFETKDTFNANVIITGGNSFFKHESTFNKAVTASSAARSSFYDTVTLNDTFTLADTAGGFFGNANALVTDITLKDQATMNTEEANISVLGTLTLAGSSTFNVSDNSLLDTSNGKLEIENSTTALIVDDNSVLRAALADFGTIDITTGTIDTTGASVQKRISNLGTLALVAGDDFVMDKITALKISRDEMDWSSIISSGPNSGDVYLTSNGLTGLYSLSYVPTNIELSENIMAGTLGEDGKDYTVTAHGIVKNSLDQSVNSVIKNGSFLYLTGANADKVLLDEGSLSIAGDLILEHPNGDSATVKGDITVNDYGDLEAYSHITLDGKFTVNGGAVDFYDGSTFNADVTINEGNNYFYDGSTFNAGVTINEGNNYFYDNTTFNAGVTIHEGNNYFNDDTTFNANFTMDGGSLTISAATFKENFNLTDGQLIFSRNGHFAKNITLDGTSSTQFSSSGTKVLGTLTVVDDASLYINNASTLDISDGKFVVDTTGTFILGANSTLQAALADFGTIESGTLNTTNGSVKTKLINNGTLELMVADGTTISKTQSVQLSKNMDWSSILTDTSTGSVKLSGANFTGLYSLTWLPSNNIDLPENIMAGTLGNDGGSYSVSAHGIVKNTEENLTDSYITKDSTLTLSGENKGNILLDEGSLTNEGSLTLGNGSAFNGTMKGDFINTNDANLDADMYITFDGKFKQDGGTTYLNDGSTFNAEYSINDGEAYLYDGSTFNAEYSINGGGAYLYDGAIFNGSVTVSGGEVYVNDGGTFNESLTVSGGFIGVYNNSDFNKSVNVTSGALKIQANSTFNESATISNTGGATVVDSVASFTQDLTIKNEASLDLEWAYINVFGTLSVVDTANVTVANYSVVNTVAGTLKVDTAGSFEVEAGSTLRAALTDFGTIESGILNTTNGFVKTKLENDGTLELMVAEGTTMSKAQSVQVSQGIDWSSILTDTSTGTVMLNGANFTGLYSLTWVPNDIELPENIMAGSLGSGGGVYDVMAHGIVKNTDESVAQSSIATGSSLTLTGANEGNVLYGADAGTGLINNGTLILGSANIESASFNGALENAGTTIVLSGVTFTGDTTVSGGTLAIDTVNRTVTTKNVTVANGANLVVTSGTLDVSGGSLNVASGANVTTSAGATMAVKASDFGTFTQSGSFTAGTNIQETITNEGAISLMDVGFETMSKAAEIRLYQSPEFTNLVTGLGTVSLKDVELTGLYSLTYLKNGVFNEDVMAGAMGAGFDATFNSIVKNTDESVAQSTIATGSKLTLTGANAGNVLYGADAGTGLINNGTLILGSANIESASFNGALENAGTTTVLSGVTITGATNVSSGTLAIDAANRTVTTSSMSVANGANLVVTGGTLDVSGGSLNVASGANVTTSAGATMAVKASDFGTFTQSGSFTAGTNIQETITNEGAISLMDVGFETMSKAAEIRLYQSPEFTNLVTGLGTVSLKDVELTGLYSLTYLKNGVFNEDVMAGAMGAGFDATFNSIVKNTDESVAQSSIATGSKLTLTGTNAGNVLYNADAGTGLINNGVLLLGSADVQSASFNGALESAGTTAVLSNVTFGETLSISGGTTTFENASTIEGKTSVTSGGTLTMNAKEKVLTTNGLEMASGTLNLLQGTIDSTAGFTADTGSILQSAQGTTLLVTNASIGMGADGTASGTATVGAYDDTTDMLKGSVVISGFTSGTKLDYNGEYALLSAAVNNAYGFDASISLVGITATGLDLDDAVNANAGRGDNTLGGQSVDVGSGEVKAGSSVTVGSLSGTPTGGGKIQNSGSLTITGLSDEQLTEVGIDNTDGELTLGKGTVGGNLKNTNGNVIITGAVKTEGETINTGTNNTFTVLGGASYETEKFTGTKDATITVGTSLDSQPAYFIADEVSLNGANLITDPAWQNGIGIEGASVGAFGSFTNNAVDGTLVAGQNSYIVLGNTDVTWAQKSFADSGLTWGSSAVTAALFIAKPQNLHATQGAIDVDGSLTASSTPLANTANFAANSLLVVNGDGLGSQAALTATNGKLTVDGTAKLVVSGTTIGEIVIAEGFNAGSTVTNEGWGLGSVIDPVTGKASNVMTDSLLTGIESVLWDASTGTFKVSTMALKIELDNVDNSVNAFYTAARNAGLDGQRAAFVNYVTGRNSAGEAHADAASTAQGTPMVAAVGAVAASALSVGNAMGEAIVAYNNGAGTGMQEGSVAMNLNNGETSLNAGDGMKNGFGVWLTPLYNWNNVSGMGSSGFESGYSSGLGGIALGMDYTVYDALRVGLAFNVGAGYSESTGDFNSTNNNFDFWGLSLYAAYQKNNFGITFDIGYSGISSEMDQDLPMGTGLGQAEAETYSSLWTVGLNAEYTFKTSMLDITPHAGIRYMGVTTHGHTVTSANASLFEVEDDFQGIWYFPVGVTLSKDFELESGWSISPKLDVGFVAAAGDLEANTEASMRGVSNTMDLTMQNVDGFAFKGGLGVDIANENMSFGLNYNIQASEHTTGHMIFANFRYEF